jgi:hypothetical protein
MEHRLLMTGWTFDVRTHAIGGEFQLLPAVFTGALQIFSVFPHGFRRGGCGWRRLGFSGASHHVGGAPWTLNEPLEAFHLALNVLAAFLALDFELLDCAHSFIVAIARIGKASFLTRSFSPARCHFLDR